MSVLKDLNYTRDWIDKREWNRTEGRRATIAGVWFYPYDVVGLPHIGAGIRYVSSEWPQGKAHLSQLDSRLNQILETNAQILKQQLNEWDLFPKELQLAFSSFLYNTGAYQSTLYDIANNRDWQTMLDWWGSHYTTAGGQPILVNRRNSEVQLARQGLSVMGIDNLEANLPIPQSGDKVNKSSPVSILLIVVALLMLVRGLSRKKQGA